MYSTFSRDTPEKFPRNAGWEKVNYIACKHVPLKIGHSWEYQVSKIFFTLSLGLRSFLQRLRTT